MSRVINHALIVFLLCPRLVAATPSAQQDDEPASSLRRFVVDKPRTTTGGETPSPVAPFRLPGLASPADRMRGSIGLGYVQGADWGTDVRAAGSFAGWHVDVHGLLTASRRNTLFDHGLLTVGSPGGRWSFEGGDVFSILTGPGRGARVSWNARGSRRPSISWSTSLRGFDSRPTLLTYRDQWRIARDSVIEGEIASDGSHLAAVRSTFGRVSVEAADRRRRTPASHDRSAGGSVTLWRNIRVRGSFAESIAGGQRARWQTTGVDIPLGRVELGIERTFSLDGAVRQTTTGVMGGVTAGSLRLFHRQQWGLLDYQSSDLAFLQQMRHLQSMATYGTGARVRVTLQLASQWMPSGRVNVWEELQTSWQATRGTSVDLAVSIPRITATDRLRLRLTQQLPKNLAAELEYGRVAPYQVATIVGDAPRVRAMLRYRFDVVTPPGRADASGIVVDHAGRPVPHVVVRLGEYAAATGPDGRYQFHNLPPGSYDLFVDDVRLSADYAWDGRRQRVDTARPDRREIVMRVAPLGTITGRVFVDRNRNERFDDGEELAGVVVSLNGARATASDARGVYGFYNLQPGSYVIEVEAAAIGPELRAIHPVHDVTLDAERPIAGLDFIVAEVDRPIIWNGLP